MVKLQLKEEERCIIDVLNPHNRRETLPKVLPLDFILNNKICLALHAAMGQQLESKYSSEELKEIRRRIEMMRFSMNEIRNIARIFEDRGVNYVLLFKAIKSHCDSTDIDIIVDKTQIDEVRKILEQLGYIRTLWGKCVYVKSEGYSKIVQIDIHEEEHEKLCSIFSRGTIRVLDNKREVNGLYLPSPEDELLIIFAFDLFKVRSITLCTILHVARLLEECYDISYIQHSVKEHAFRLLLHMIYIVNIIYRELYGTEIKSELVSISKEACEHSKVINFLSRIITRKIKLPFESKILFHFHSVYELFYDMRSLDLKSLIKNLIYCFSPVTASIKLLCSSLSRKRILICFSGVDGSGKTTHATKLVRRLKDMGIPCQYVWRHWSPKISLPLVVFIYFITRYRRKDYHRSKILRKIWNYVVILDYICIYLFRIKPYLLIGKNVVCDRYVYDLIADLMYDGLYNERASKILLKFVPRPDLVFMLDVPEYISYARKRNTEDAVNIKGSVADYLKIHRNAYLKIAESLNIPVIDATKDFDELHEEIYKQVIQTYINKQKSKRKIWKKGISC